MLNCETGSMSPPLRAVKSLSNFALSYFVISVGSTVQIRQVDTLSLVLKNLLLIHSWSYFYVDSLRILLNHIAEFNVLQIRTTWITYIQAHPTHFWTAVPQHIVKRVKLTPCRECFSVNDNQVDLWWFGYLVPYCMYDAWFQWKDCAPMVAKAYTDLGGGSRKRWSWNI